MKTVREFSSIGPCITLGELTKETATGYRFMDRDGRTGHVQRKHGLRHIEPCRSCRDHPQTQYPEGYMD